MFSRIIFTLIVAGLMSWHWSTSSTAAPKPVPRMQAVPQAYDQVSFQRDGVELTRYHYGAGLKRPFAFPVVGPSGRSLTRMGHPRDPQSHGHHNSVWLGHQFVNKANFWENAGTAKVAHVRMLRMDDSDAVAFLEAENAWLDKDGRSQMQELRRVTVMTLPQNEWMMVIDAQFAPAKGVPEVVLGETAFGMIGVRMAKTIGVHDGGGTIRNSEGEVDEAGCFRKPARWCDYSGPITASASEGVTLMDHPQNLNHPVPFHVRNDGWMGAALTFPGAHTITPAAPLRLRYGLYVHSGVPAIDVLQKQWESFAATSFEEFPAKK